ncbi:hypothetical protein NW119_09840 [Staphylococcus pettenkoferi]|nr:hypothetical protein [Staphylococcus pettenkoferi]
MTKKTVKTKKKNNLLSTSHEQLDKVVMMQGAISLNGGSAFCSCDEIEWRALGVDFYRASDIA